MRMNFNLNLKRLGSTGDKLRLSAVKGRCVCVLLPQSFKVIAEPLKATAWPLTVVVKKSF